MTTDPYRQIRKCWGIKPKAFSVQDEHSTHWAIAPAKICGIIAVSHVIVRHNAQNYQIPFVQVPQRHCLVFNTCTIPHLRRYHRHMQDREQFHHRERLPSCLYIHIPTSPPFLKLQVKFTHGNQMAVIWEVCVSITTHINIRSFKTWDTLILLESPLVPPFRHYPISSVEAILTIQIHRLVTSFKLV